MKEEEIENYRKAAEEGTTPDNENPIFLFQGCSNMLLVQIAGGRFNLLDLAKRELENRGLNLKGEWVGFKKQIEKKKTTPRKGRRI